MTNFIMKVVKTDPNSKFHIVHTDKGIYPDTTDLELQNRMKENPDEVIDTGYRYTIYEYKQTGKITLIPGQGDMITFENMACEKRSDTEYEFVKRIPLKGKFVQINCFGPDEELVKEPIKIRYYGEPDEHDNTYFCPNCYGSFAPEEVRDCMCPKCGIEIDYEYIYFR